MAPTMSSRIAVRGIEFTLTLLLVSLAQAINYEVHRHDVIPPNRNDNIILTSRDFLEQLNFVTPKASYTLQEATEHLLQFGALLRARVLDTFGRLLYVYYDDFSIAEVEALHEVYREILERRYDIFDLVVNVLRNPDTRPSRICATIYDHTTKSCLRNSASMCRRIRKQHDLPHPHDRDTPALNDTYRIYRLSKISKQYPRGFSLAIMLRYLQREVLTITPNLLSGLLHNVRYENDDDVRFAEKELIRHFREITGTSKIPMSTKELRKFHTMNSFLKYYINTYAEKFLNNDLKKHAFLIARRIANDVGVINENIHLLGNVYENRTIHIGYLFDLVLPDDLLEKDVIEAKKYLVTKLNKFDVVEKYLRVQKYQQATPAQLTMEITGQLRDIDFAKSIATSLRMHARFWHRSRMIENLDELLELFDTYENLRQLPRYLHMMRKIDKIKESLRDMKDIPVEILCNAPRACLRIGLQLVLRCKFISSQIKDSIKDFLELSDVCLDPVYMIQESRRSVEIPFKISKVRYSTALQTKSTFINGATTQRAIKHKTTESESEEQIPTESLEESSEEFASIPTTLRTTIGPTMSISKIHQEETTTVTNTTAATTTTTSPATTTQSATTTTLPTTLFTTTTTLPTTITKMLSTTTTLPTTIMLPMTTTVAPTISSTALPTTTTELPTTTTTSSTTTMTTLPITTTTISPTTSTTLPTTTTTSPTTIMTMLPMTTTTSSTTTTTMPITTSTLPTTRASSIITTELPVIDLDMNLERSKAKRISYSDEVIQPLKNLTKPASIKSCESNECEQTSESVETITILLSTKQSPTTTTTTPTMQTSTHKIIVTSSKPATIYQDFVSEAVTTELSETAVTKGNNCAKSCLEDCRSKSESFETSRRSCETSCDSVTEDCDEEENSASKDYPECGMGSDKNCGCATKEEKSAECMTLCPSDAVESSSCERTQSGCTTSVVPTVGTKLEGTRKRGMCEIRDPHHRRQLKRLAKMRAISAAAVNVVTSRADVLRPTTSRHRDRIATKKLYNLLATRLPHSKDPIPRRIAEYLLKEPLSRLENENDKNRRRRKQQKQIHRQERRRLAKKFDGELTQGTTMHRTREITPSRHSQIKRIPERSAKSMSA